jgi:hypothetical protein
MQRAGDLGQAGHQRAEPCSVGSWSFELSERTGESCGTGCEAFELVGQLDVSLVRGAGHGGPNGYA